MSRSREGRRRGSNSDDDLHIKSASLFSSTDRTARYSFKVYVYELPLWANQKIAKSNPWCEESVFGTEQLFHHQFTDNAHGVRTWNADEADFFYVPVYSTCLVYRNFALFKKYRYLVKEVLRYIINTYPYWSLSSGRDHIWPMVHDFGGCLSWLDNQDHIYFKELRNSIFLSHVGDLALGCFSTYKDIVVPPLVANTQITKDGQGGMDIDPAKRHTFIHFRGTVHWVRPSPYYFCSLFDLIDSHTLTYTKRTHPSF
jgi:hypothetical protein